MKMKNFNLNFKVFKRLKNSEAFTLIELVMVILLIGILAAVVLPKFVNLTGAANKAASQGVVWSLGEGLTTQLSKNLVNNDLSSYFTITGVTVTPSATGTVKFLGTAPSATTAGSNTYENPFLILPNYVMSATGNGSGTTYNFGDPTSVTPMVSNSWWINFAAGTAVGPGNLTTPVVYTPTCDNTLSTNSNFLQPKFDVPNNEYILPLGAVDYVYSNGSTIDSYAYYMEYSINGNVDGFNFVPCQS
ncbi:MAG: prepilin-type N-terminal cleavage/methylation domain-containing protein [bacterium]